MGIEVFDSTGSALLC